MSDEMQGIAKRGSIVSILASVFGIALVVLIAAGAWQQARYAGIRRGPVQDRQPFWYPAETFHVLTYLQVSDGGDLVEELRKLRDLLEASGEARMIYAGQAAFLALQSEQLPEIPFNGGVLVQYPSRDAYEAMAHSESYRAALAGFVHHYSYGFERPRALNLAIHQALLGIRLRDLVTFRPSRFPFAKAEEIHLREEGARRQEGFDALLALSPRGDDAVVVLNLLKKGSAEQRAADRGYGLAMAGGFAEGAYGPMHFGLAKKVEGDAHFDQVAMVYYPGVRFMRDMVESTFFNEIVGGKQPGDTMAMITVPILDEL
jgi:uncharacterized protein (DUF1330 family)